MLNKNNTKTKLEGCRLTSLIGNLMYNIENMFLVKKNKNKG